MAVTPVVRAAGPLSTININGAILAFFNLRQFIWTNGGGIIPPATREL